MSPLIFYINSTLYLLYLIFFFSSCPFRHKASADFAAKSAAQATPSLSSFPLPASLSAIKHRRISQLKALLKLLPSLSSLSLLALFAVLASLAVPNSFLLFSKHQESTHIALIPSRYTHNYWSRKYIRRRAFHVLRRNGRILLFVHQFRCPSSRNLHYL